MNKSAVSFSALLKELNASNCFQRPRCYRQMRLRIYSNNKLESAHEYHTQIPVRRNRNSASCFDASLRRSMQPSRVQVYYVPILLNDYVSFDIELTVVFVCVTLYGDLVLLVGCKGIRRIIDFTSSRNKPGPGASNTHRRGHAAALFSFRLLCL